MKKYWTLGFGFRQLECFLSYFARVYRVKYLVLLWILSF